MPETLKLNCEKEDTQNNSLERESNMNLNEVLYIKCAHYSHKE